MSLSEKEIALQKEAINYIKKNKYELIKEFITNKKPLPFRFFAFFMAGSPGAGKTEFSERYLEAISRKVLSEMKKDKELIKLFSELKIDIQDYKKLFIHIDVDEIRSFLPQYKKTDVEKSINGNAHVVQRAAGHGLDILRKYCLENSISFLHDGTFGSQYSTIQRLIKKSLKANRNVQIFYVYTDPVIAWDITQKREYLEGRNVKKENFVDQFFKSVENVNRAKKEFGGKIIVNCVLKDKDDIKKIKEIKFNQTNVANFLEIEYAKGTIKKYNRRELEELL